ncbi:MAG: HlyC/CorC family transporter [Selenomonadaceae bacterium]|nr:HlyC/CorC family transporter [Selenomonadaceae bacterium]
MKEVYFLDSPSPGLLLVLITCPILANAFFSLAETALTKSHKGPLEKMAEDGNPDARAALDLLENPDETQSVVQIGITLMGILSGLCTGLLAAPILSGLFPFLPHAYAISMFLGVLAVTCLLLLLGEFLPKKIALQYPENILLKHHRALSLLTRLAHPFVSFLSGSANTILLIFGMNPQIEETVTEDEVKDLIEQGTEDGTFEKTEQDMVDRIFRLGDQTAYALMTPRTQMLWLDLEDSLRHNLRMIRENPQTVFPVGRNSLDEFCGVLYAKDLLDASLAKKSLDIAQYIRKPMSIPRSMETFRLLEKFRDTGIHEAMVLDEYGGVIGFITLDDILLKIIGSNTQGSSDTAPFQISQRDENSWSLEGLCPIDEFKKRFDIEELPEEDHDHFQTMGGFLTSYFGYIPKKGEACEWNGFRFEVVNMDRARIDKILVTRKPASGSTAPSQN